MKMFKILLACALLLVTFMVQAEDGVARSVITSAIEEKEPVDQISEMGTDSSKIYFFTEIRGMEGHAITHRWEQGGEIRAEVKFDVGGNRWRVWSSKNLLDSWLGEWTVSVIDEGGNTMAQEKFNYIEAVAGESDAESAAQPEQGEDMPASE